MHSIRVKSINLNDSTGKTRATEALMTSNASRIPTLAIEKISYLGWLKKVLFEEAGQTIAVVELRSPEVANEVIVKNLVWDGEVHACEKFIRNCRVKQCFNCWVYGHIGIQCRSFSKCGNCGETGHRSVECTALRFRAKCAVCGGPHRVNARTCHRHKAEAEKVKLASIGTFFLFPVVRSVLTFTLTQQTKSLGVHPPPSSVIRGGESQDLKSQETTSLAITTPQEAISLAFQAQISFQSTPEGTRTGTPD